MSMQYPADLSGEADYVSFQHVEYRGRRGTSDGGGGITLYLPAPAPAVPMSNSWSSSGEKFAGPVGQFRRDVAETAVGIASAEDFSIGGIRRGLSDTLEKFKNTKVGPMARQAGMVAAGQLAGVSANQIMSVTRGEIYNPNIEMFYNGPQLRSFDFSFTMSPKSKQDAQAILAICKEFKTWSAPQEDGQKYKIPHVWKISYGGAAAKYYNKFHAAACTSVNVQYNAGMDQHMTFIDGCPVVTGLMLSFTEVEIVTRKHARQGY